MCLCFEQDELLEQTAIPPTFLKCDLSTFDLNSLNIKFDVLLVIPPLEEYQQKLGVTNTIYWNWEQVSLTTRYRYMREAQIKYVFLTICLMQE